AKELEERDAVHFRHFEIEEDERCAVGLEVRPSLLAIAGRGYAEALGAQHFAERLAHLLVVVDDKNGQRLRLPFTTSCRRRGKRSFRRLPCAVSAAVKVRTPGVGRPIPPVWSMPTPSPPPAASRQFRGIRLWPRIAIACRKDVHGGRLVHVHTLPISLGAKTK